jgi:hypothetical protein
VGASLEENAKVPPRKYGPREEPCTELLGVVVLLDHVPLAWLAESLSKLHNDPVFPLQVPEYTTTDPLLVLAAPKAVVLGCPSRKGNLFVIDTG